jgi:hypothetical protein
MTIGVSWRLCSACARVLLTFVELCHFLWRGFLAGNRGSCVKEAVQCLKGDAVHALGLRDGDDLAVASGRNPFTAPHHHAVWLDIATKSREPGRATETVDDEIHQHPAIFTYRENRSRGNRRLPA